jgi:hypothetical protein
VDRRFGLAEPLEHRFGALPGGCRQRGVIDQVKDVVEASVRAVIVGMPAVLVRIVAVLVVMLVVGVMMTVRSMIVPVLAVFVAVLVDAEFRRRDAGAQHAVGVHVRVAEGEAAERRTQVGKRQAGVEQRADGHVAGNAREAVEIQHARH